MPFYLDLSGTYSDTLFGTNSGILSSILPSIYSDSLTFYLASTLTSYLASILTFYMAFYLYLTSDCLSGSGFGTGFHRAEAQASYWAVQVLNLETLT